MKQQLSEFLEHLLLNENASAHTVRAYESDLAQFLSSIAKAGGRRRIDRAVGGSRAAGVEGTVPPDPVDVALTPHNEPQTNQDSPHSSGTAQGAIRIALPLTRLIDQIRFE